MVLFCFAVTSFTLEFLNVPKEYIICNSGTENIHKRHNRDKNKTNITNSLKVQQYISVVTHNKRNNREENSSY